MSRERRWVGGRDYQALIEMLKESLALTRKAVTELSNPNLPADYRLLWARKGETAYANALGALWELESIGRAAKGDRLAEGDG